MGKQEEYFEVYDPAGNAVGIALRSMCHGHPELRHHTSHVVVYHPDGRLLLQKRSMSKDIQPGKWDTAVGGHVNLGEDYLAAAYRELAEELGVTEKVTLEFCFYSTIANEIETEDCAVYKLIYPGPFQKQDSEVDLLRFFTREELLDPAWQEEFTPNLKEEIKQLLALEQNEKPRGSSDSSSSGSGFGTESRIETEEMASQDGSELSPAGESTFAMSQPASRLFRRFWSDPMARLGSIGILFLFIPAFLAPFLANGRPWIRWQEGKGVDFPALRYFFVPDTTEILIEQLFNYLFLLGGIFLVSCIFRNKSFRKIFFLVSALLALIPFFTVQSRLDKTNYRAESGTMLFAPIAYGPYEIVGQPGEKPSKNHWLGCDDIGRDVASRMIYGGRVSLAVGVLSSVLALVLGTAAGLWIGYVGGKWDLWMMRLVEVLVCFPTFLLLLILMSVFADLKFKQSILIVIGVIGLTGWIGICMLLRGEVLKHRAMPYILSCEVIGMPRWRTLFVHLLPNVSGPLLISFSFAVAGAILAESSLSFLGFGVQQPTASWGGLLKQAYSDPFAYWHLTLFPGIALFIAVSGFNFVGEGLRKIFDPKS